MFKGKMMRCYYDDDDDVDGNVVCCRLVVSCEQEEPIKKKRQSLPAYLIYFFGSVSFSIDRLADLFFTLPSYHHHSKLLYCFLCVSVHTCFTLPLPLKRICKYGRCINTRIFVNTQTHSTTLHTPFSIALYKKIFELLALSNISLYFLTRQSVYKVYMQDFA